MAKKVPLTRFPDAAAVNYSRAIEKMIESLGKETFSLFDKYVAPELTNRTDAQYTEDGIYEGIKKMFQSLKTKANNIFTTVVTERAASSFIKNVNRFNRHNLEQQMKVKGIDLVATEPWLKDFIRTKIEDNVGYIKTIPENYFDRIENVVNDGVKSGASVKKMRGQLMEQVDISKNKAQFIAVDQAGSILGQMTAQRHQNIGIDKFKWLTSKDERVRDSHRKLGGEIYSYNDPPEVNGRVVLPGEDYRCRCVAIPIFDDEEDDAEEPNFLRVNASESDYPDDYQAIQQELAMIPEDHRKILSKTVKEIRIINDRPSYYERKTGILNILEGMEKGELVHELGHAIETKMDFLNNKVYQSLLKNAVKGKTFSDIYLDVSTYVIPVFMLQSDRFVSEYQGRLYEDAGFMDDDGELNIEAFGEYFSEGYKEFLLNPENLKKKDQALYEFIKGLKL